MTSFDTAAAQGTWSVTLDGVMGGLSSGEVSFSDSTMLFTGEVVTAGGGFSLLRTRLEPGSLASGQYLVVRVLADSRGYEMVFKDDIEGRPRQLFHEANVPLAVSEQWQEVRVPLSGLSTTSNGRSVEAEPFQADEAVEMGVIIKDGVDGSFRLELDWIDVCSE